MLAIGVAILVLAAGTTNAAKVTVDDLMKLRSIVGGDLVLTTRGGTASLPACSEFKCANQSPRPLSHPLLHPSADCQPCPRRIASLGVAQHEPIFLLRYAEAVCAKHCPSCL